MFKVLVVEDDNSLREAISFKLKKKGYDVVEAIDGEDALIKATSELPDLIILDIGLPKIRGTEVLKRIHIKPALRNIPVVMLTNYDFEDSILDELNGEEPKYYLRKDETSLEELLEKVEEILR